MNKTFMGALRVLLIFVVFSPIFGCSDSDDGGTTTQAQPEPTTEAVTTAPEAEPETVAPPTEIVTVDIEEGVPGGVLTNIVEVSAEVTAVDTEKRGLTLKGSDGEEFEIEVGPQAVNFGQIQVGDTVNARVIKELVIALMPQPAELPEGEAAEAIAPDGAAGIVALAPKGAQPGGLVAETAQITATIEAIDEVNRTATLSLEDGSTRTVRVRDDIDLSQRKVGEKVVFLMTEMLAISVEKL